MTGDNSNPVLSVAKERKKTESDVIVINGIRISVVPVSAALIEEITRKVKDPPVPMVPREDDPTRMIPNPGDPNYIEAIAEATSKRNRAAIDAMALFGVELLDGMPEDDKWMTRLKYLQRLGHISLEGFDTEDPMDREFLYKRYVLVNGELLERVSRASGVNPADIEAAEQSFRSSPVGSTD